MPTKRMSAQRIVVLLRQIEVQTSQGETIQTACREAGISGKGYCRYREEYGGPDMERVRRLKELEKESNWLRRLAVDFSFEKQVLEDVAAGKF